MRMRGVIRATLLLALLLATALRSGPAAARAAPKSVTCAATFAQVQTILRGLQVAAPKKKYASGKAHQQLAAAWAMRTRKAQLAAICFRDGSLLHMNQETTAVLTDPTHTTVKKGEIEQFVTPGTSHEVITASATASAVGTQFDLKISGKITTLTVIEGAVLLASAAGSVVVTTGKQSTVQTGQAPTQPAAVDTATVVAWTNALPAPSTPLPVNLGLEANGGSIDGSSGGATTPSGTVSGDPHNAIDGNPATAWETRTGASFGQSFTIGLPRGNIYAVDAVALNCTAPGGDATRDLSGFTVSVSSTGSDAASFHPVVQATCADAPGMQRFDLTAPAQAGLVRLTVNSNHGSALATDLAEFMVIGSPVSTGSLPAPTPAPSGYQFQGLSYGIGVSGAQFAYNFTWTLAGHECGNPQSSPWVGNFTDSYHVVTGGQSDQSFSGVVTWTLGPDGSFVPQLNGDTIGVASAATYTMTFTLGTAPTVHLKVDFSSAQTQNSTVAPLQQTVSVPLTPYSNCP